jgi:hypothetical protein
MGTSITPFLVSNGHVQPEEHMVCGKEAGSNHSKVDDNSEAAMNALSPGDVE